MTMPQPIPTQKGGFLSALFDTSFSRLVTTRVIKWLYLLVMILIGLGLLGFVISAIAGGSVTAIVLALVLGPLVALLYLIYARVLLEVILAIFRILESNREIAFLQRQQLSLLQQQDGAPQSPDPAGGVPPVPPYQPPQPPAA
jgi:cellulose synthase/poly-beta-1,6-N-acetylglucosamine synthase-like glycosyltransferase